MAKNSTSAAVKANKSTAKSAAKSTAKKAAAKVARKAIDYTAMKTPYRDDTSQGIVFNLIASGKVKKSDLKAKALAELAKSKKTTKNISALIRASIGDAERRGWKFGLKGEYLTVTHPATK